MFSSYQKGKKNPKNEVEDKAENMLCKNTSMCFFSSGPSNSDRLVSEVVKFDGKNMVRYVRDTE